VKVRLGRLIQGQQKGVDALIYRDLMTLARERAIARAYLLSGDEDLREGVVAAQDMGVQVILLGIPTSQRSNQSAALIREADEHVVLPKEHWARYFAKRGTTTPLVEASTTDAQIAGRTFGLTWATEAEPSDVAALHDRHPRIPRDIDIALLVHAEKSLGPLHDRQDLKHEVRAGFWSAVEDVARQGRGGAQVLPA
jgi:hypothetical protein